MVGVRRWECAYGENPYQSPAGLFGDPNSTYPLAVSRFQVVDGRTPSYINCTDIGRAVRTAARIAAGHDYNFRSVPLIAIAVKHGNACGAAVGSDPAEVLQRMVMGDPQSVFGSVMMTNFPITMELAVLLRRFGVEEGAPGRLFDGVCAPAIAEDAFSVLARRDGKYFLAINPALADLSFESLDRTPMWRQLPGGDFLLQPANTFVWPLDRMEVVGKALTPKQNADVVTASAVCATSISNTITIVGGGQLLANAVGQQSRVLCCELAISKAQSFGHDLTGAVVASDSFFPFPDGPEVLLRAGTLGGISVIQATNGSRGDNEVLEACKRHGTTMVWLPDAEARVFDGH
jgi:phosphoribosylaminoimidazolecarboxamide formyltransferase/IMP cyclohydrolase